MILVVFDSPQSGGYIGWLKKELSKLGIRTADLCFLNLIEEKPAGANNRVLKSQIDANAEAFYEALSLTEASVIVPMGPDATRAVMAQPVGIDDVRGYVIDLSECGSWTLRKNGIIGFYKQSNSKKGYKKGDPRRGVIKYVTEVSYGKATAIIPTYSIDQIITSKMKLFFAFAQDFDRANRYISGGVSLIDDGFTYETEPVVGWVPKNRRLAFDIETPMDSRDVIMISLSDGETSMALAWDAEIREYVRGYLEDINIVKYAHNSMFDVPRLRDAGVNVAPLVFDTMVGGRFIQPDLPKALGKMVPTYLDARRWKHKYETEPHYYSAKDSYNTFHLGEILFELCFSDPERTAHCMRIMNALPVLLDMHEKGIAVNHNDAKEWEIRLQNELSGYLSKWARLTAPIAAEHGHPMPEPSKSRQVERLFHQWLGMERQKNRSDGNTLDAVALFNLKTLYPQHAELIETLKKIRIVGKQLGTYAKMLSGLDKTAARIHPDYLPAGVDERGNTQRDEGESKNKGGASTGRWGVANPNPQNQTPDAKRIYVPDCPNCVFMEADYSQAELRVMAAMSGDFLMLADLEGDVHTTVATNLGIPRQIAKNTIYASSYLGGPRTIQEMMKKKDILVSESEIKKAQALLKGRWNVMYGWQAALIEAAKNSGMIRNSFGRIRYFYGLDRQAPEMADFIPQSTIADIVWKIILPLHNAAKEYNGRLVTAVHDSFLFQVPAESASAARRMFEGIMVGPFSEVAPGFTLPVEWKIGKPGESWGSMKAD